MARPVIMNVVVGGLAVWAVVVMVWMTLLGGNWESNNCRGSKARLQRTVELTSAQVPSPYTTFNVTTFAKLQAEPATNSQTAFSKRLQYYSSLIEGNHSTLMSDSQNCTLVVQTYKRTDVLPKFLSHYCKMPVIRQILVVLNDMDQTVSGALTSLASKCHAKLLFMKSDANRITNRYIPRKEIKTDCVYLVDDDQLASIYDLQFGMEVWQNFKHLVIGFEENAYVKDAKGTYTYVHHPKRISTSKKKHSSHHIEVVNGTKILDVGGKTYNLGKVSAAAQAAFAASNKPTKPTNMSLQPEGYSMMKTPCFVHRAYLEMYFDPLMVPTEAVEYVNKLRNCEDILLSIMVTKFLHDTNRPQCGVMGATPSVTIKSLEGESGSKDLSRRPGYFDERSKCLQNFSELFGYLPLQGTNSLATLV